MKNKFYMILFLFPLILSSCSRKTGYLASLREKITDKNGNSFYANIIEKYPIKKLMYLKIDIDITNHIFTDLDIRYSFTGKKIDIKKEFNSLNTLKLNSSLSCFEDDEKILLNTPITYQGTMTLVYEYRNNQSSLGMFDYYLNLDIISTYVNSFTYLKFTSDNYLYLV